METKLPCVRARVDWCLQLKVFLRMRTKKKKQSLKNYGLAWRIFHRKTGRQSKKNKMHTAISKYYRCLHLTTDNYTKIITTVFRIRYYGRYFTIFHRSRNTKRIILRRT